MKVRPRQFNIYLMLAAVVGLLGGCSTLTNALTKKPDGPTAALRVHIEASPNLLGTSQTVSVLRAAPVLVTIAKNPILTEANIISAKLIDTPGGFAVEVRFDETGSWILEQYTAANPGLHLVIFGQWGDKLANGRWLAAPIITHRIGNGVIAFTPDMSRAEAEQLVTGLNNVAKFNKKQPK